MNDRHGGRAARGGMVLVALAASLVALAAPAWGDASVTDGAQLEAAIPAPADQGTDTTITLSGDAFDVSSAPIVWQGPGVLTLAGDPAFHPVLDAGGVSRVLQVDGGTVVLGGLTVTGGHATDGGGALVDGGTLAATGVTFTGNVADDVGGALAVQALGAASLTDSTVSGNRAGGLSGAGGIDVGPLASLTLVNDTVAFNTGSATAPGGLSGPVNATNTLVALNRPRDCAAGATAADHDLDSDGTCSASTTAADPRLAPLGDNGGPTPTHALRADSPARGGAHGGACGDPDQTGLARPLGGVCDIGAYEFTPPSATTSVPRSVGTTSAVLQALVAAGHRETVRFDYGLTRAYGEQTAPQPFGSSGPVTAEVDGLTPGTTYHYRVVVETADGTFADTPVPDRTFTTAALPPAAPKVVTQTVSVTPPIVEAQLLPPLLSGLRLQPTAIIPMAFGGSVARAHGARVTYTARNSILTTFTVDRIARGLRRGRTCVRRPARSRGPACARFVRLAGSFSHEDGQGVNAFRFTGGLGGRRLALGRYRLNATPQDLTGRFGPTISATFRVVRR